MTETLFKRQWQLLFGAWAIALIATLGALFIGEVMGQTPCVLCWYQRIAMFPLVATIGAGLYLGDTRSFVYSLPLALIGLAVAGFHALLFYGVVPEAIRPCTASGPSCSDANMTIFGFLPLPLLSLLSFAGITLLLTLSSRRPTP